MNATILGRSDSSDLVPQQFTAVHRQNGLLLLTALLIRVVLLLTVLTVWSVDYLLHPRLSGGQHS